MPTVSRRNMILLTLGTNPDGGVAEGVGGITRLQKLLYLLEKEENLTPTEDGFDFAAYNYGPYSASLYDDLEWLENFGLIESEVTAEATEAEAAEVDLLDFDELLGDGAEPTDDGSADGLGGPDALEERRFIITKDGAERIKSLIKSGEYDPVVDGIRRVKGKYGKYSLSELLHYVYKKFPEMTVESEIKEKVLRRRH